MSTGLRRGPTGSLRNELLDAGQRVAKTSPNAAQLCCVLARGVEWASIRSRSLSLSKRSAEPLHLALILAHVSKHGFDLRKQIEPVDFHRIVMRFREVLVLSRHRIPDRFRRGRGSYVGAFIFCHAFLISSSSSVSRAAEVSRTTWRG